ncbi:hypothetical protein BHM03_00027383 [Ensete ventricosum]|nr:hypothetical protein BHM03_00027383 [Ensete ventricosum]
MSGNSSSRYPFTPSQWQELEQQSLFYRYMVSGVPNPWDLSPRIRRRRRSFLFEPPTTMISPTAAYPPHLHFRLGFGREGEDTEPGRCRRTDGKKWRCSKEAFPGSKYCEKHMHRGKNRSRKPVEMSLANNLSSTTAPRRRRRRLPPPPIPPVITIPIISLYQHGMKTVDEHFSEAAGGERKNSLVGKGHMVFVPQPSTSSHSTIHLPKEEKPQHCFVLGTDLKLEKPATTAAKHKPLLHFFDERPTTSSAACLDSKTQLSISIPGGPS